MGEIQGINLWLALRPARQSNTPLIFLQSVTWGTRVPRARRAWRALTNRRQARLRARTARTSGTPPPPPIPPSPPAVSVRERMRADTGVAGSTPHPTMHLTKGQIPQNLGILPNVKRQVECVFVDWDLTLPRRWRGKNSQIFKDLTRCRVEFLVGSSA